MCNMQMDNTYLVIVQLGTSSGDVLLQVAHNVLLCLKSNERLFVGLLNT